MSRASSGRLSYRPPALITGHEDQGIICPSTRGACYRTGLRSPACGVEDVQQRVHVPRRKILAYMCDKRNQLGGYDVLQWSRPGRTSPSSLVSTHCFCFCFTRGRGGCETKQPRPFVLVPGFCRIARTYVLSTNETRQNSSV